MILLYYPLSGSFLLVWPQPLPSVLYIPGMCMGSVAVSPPSGGSAVKFIRPDRNSLRDDVLIGATDPRTGPLSLIAADRIGTFRAAML